MRRTNDQIAEVVDRVLGLPASYDPNIDYFGIVFEDPLRPEEAVYGKGFVKLSDEIQDTILQHEKGHLVSIAQHLPGHEEYDKWWGSGLDIPKDIYYNHEAEADYYASKQVGLERVLKAIKKTLAWDERWKRAANLVRLWNKQEQPLKWHRRVWLVL